MKKFLAWAWLGGVFALLYAVSFLNWANLTIDGGREMNVPLRLLNGETIYSDVYYLYGPLAPFLNAALYSALGIHLNTLYLAGTLAAIAVVVLVFRLGEALGDATDALLAAWAVIVLCVFKQNGNYIFPYTYAAVYGTMLGLAALVVQARYVHQRRSRALIFAGCLTGLALACKLEFGFAALGSLLATVISDGRAHRRRAVVRGVLPALFLPVLIYGVLLLWIPWNAVVRETFLWPGDIPQELLYFNRMKLGLNDPWKTIRELVNAVALVGLLATGVALAAARWAAGSAHGALRVIAPAWRKPLPAAAAACLIVFLGNGLVFGTRWDISPLRALPVVAAASLAAWTAGRGKPHASAERRRALMVASVYSLVVLARVILRVPSGGAYGAYLLPAPLVLFICLATSYCRPLCADAPRCVTRARRLVTSLIVTTLITATLVIAYRYARKDDALLQTSRGSVRLPPAEKEAYDGALAFMDATTRPGEYVWTVPEGSSLNFLGRRPAPLRHEILTPGFLDEEGERRAIAALEARGVKLVFVLDRPMVEFGCVTFGRECYRELMRWIASRSRVVAEFGPRGQAAFITAYARR